MPHPLFLSIPIALLCASAAAGSAVDDAENRKPSTDRPEASIGAGIASIPRYPGSDKSRVLPLPAIELRYRGFFFDREGLGLVIVDDRNSGVVIGTSLFIQFDRQEKDDPVRLRGLGDINTVPQLRAFVGKRVGPLLFRVTGARDVGGTDGTTVDLSVATRQPIGRDVMLLVGAGGTFADARFARGFFGVTEAQAAAGQREAYRASPGLYQVGTNLAVNLRVGDKWLVGSFVSVRYLVADAGNSPVVARREQVSGGLQLSYRLK